MKLKRALSLLSVLLAATAISSATSTVTLDATVQGVVSGSSITPGGVVTLDTPPVQLTLGAGTYIITDAALTGTNSAWASNNTNNGSGNWVWNFGVANDLGKVVLLEDYVGTAPGVGQSFGTQAAVTAASPIQIYSGSTLLTGETSLALFSQRLTLTGTTTLDFYVLDSFLSDNLGGISLNIDSTTPEPAVPLLIGTGLAALALYRRKRQSRVG